MWQDNLRKTNREYGSKKGRRYIKKKYSNPFFSEKKKKNTSAFSLENSFLKLSALKVKLIFLGIFVLISGAAWFLFFSDYFIIQTITAGGQGRIPAEHIQEIAWNFINKPIFLLPSKNLILTDVEKLKGIIEEKYAFNEIKIEKEYPSGLKIRFMEKEYAFIWNERSIYFYIDAAGYIIKETNLEEIQNKNYPLIVNNSNLFIDNNLIGIEKKYLDHVALILEKLKNKEGIAVEKFYVDQEINTVKTGLLEGPVIYFNTDMDIDKQVGKLLILKDERLKEDFKTKEYIDVRYGDSIYYR
jgi:hypothetical protein